MNIEQSKQVSIPEILAHHGHQPVSQRQGGQELWYRSPFGQENTPSMHVHVVKNIYKDFSSAGGKGGDALHLVSRLTGLDNKASLQWMREFTGQPQRPPVLAPRPLASVRSQDQKQSDISTNPLMLVRATALNNPSLMDYLAKERRIDPAVAQQHLQQVHYRNQERGKSYYGVGMKNDQGGYDVRSPLPNSKVVVGQEGITQLRGNRPDRTLEVYESRFDFLTKATMMKGHHRDALIINSASNYQTAIEAINRGSHRQVVIYGHNDEKMGGQRVVKAIQDGVDPSKKVIDRSGLYAPHKDMNEAWQKEGKNLFASQIQSQSSAKGSTDYKQAYLEQRRPQQTTPINPVEKRITLHH